MIQMHTIQIVMPSTRRRKQENSAIDDGSKINSPISGTSLLKPYRASPTFVVAMNPAIYYCLLLFLIPLYFLLSRNRSKRLPPGSLGLPIIGQSFSLLRAMRSNTAEKWLQDWTRKYGPVSKMNLFGTPTVFLHGQAANKFIYTCDGNILANKQPSSIRRLCGERNILELSGHDHKRIRGALISFLRPEVLKQNVGKMDIEIGKHFEKHWQGKDKVLAMPSMKTMTFSILSSLIVGLAQGARKDALVELFQQLIEGLLSIPINFPFTRFNRSLQAHAKIRTMIIDLIHEKRAALKHHNAFPQQELITCLLSLQNEDNSPVLSDEEIVDNVIIIMLAGHDTTSILLSFLIRLLANDTSVYANIIQEQEEIAESKVSGELLTWDDLARMKYTWRVAMESLRMTPPVFCSFRKVLEDFEYDGYLIPKGWQVFMAACMTHMDGSLLPEPTTFDPTHFEKPATPFSFVAFGGGPRMCPGYEFARLEALIAIHYMVTRFTWKLSCPESPFSRDPLPTFSDGLEVQIEPKIPFISKVL